MTAALKDLIKKHKSAAKAEGAAETLDSVFTALEKIIEDTGQKERFAKATTDYIEEKTKEIQSLRAARMDSAGSWNITNTLYRCIMSITTSCGFIRH